MGRRVAGPFAGAAARLLPLLFVGVACSSGSGVHATAARTVAAHAPVPTSTPDPSTPGASTPDPSTPAQTSPDRTTAPGRTTPAGPTTTGSQDATGDGLGDEPFPELGNPGIDVTHYDVHLNWDPGTGVLEGVVTVDITVTADRASFTLDATEAVDVTGVVADGTAARFEHPAPELRVTPSAPWTSGSTHRVAVTYRSEPRASTGPAGTDGGWIVTGVGTYTLDEPDLTRTWLPSDDHPSDKATWRFDVTVPAGTTVVANGTLQSTQTDDEHSEWVWEMDEPMATYLVQVVTGPYELVNGSGPGGLALQSAVLPEDRAVVQPYLDEIGPMIDWYDGWFGPYPFSGYGIAVADSVPDLAMEQQTRALFPRSLFRQGSEQDRQSFLSHELAPQWCGDAVSPASWQDVWLNEGFATYAEWMWDEHTGGDSVDRSAERALRRSWAVSPARPGRDLFGYEVYNGGAVVLQALRHTVGDATFFSILRTWVADNEGTSRTTADFVALAERVAGRSLQDFFSTWLYTTDPPSQLP